MLIERVLEHFGLKTQAPVPARLLYMLHQHRAAAAADQAPSSSRKRARVPDLAQSSDSEDELAQPSRGQAGSARCVCGATAGVGCQYQRCWSCCHGCRRHAKGDSRY